MPVSAAHQRRLFAAAMILTLTMAAARAWSQDTVILADGRELVGDVLEDSQTRLLVVTGEGDLKTFMRSQVSRVQLGAALADCVRGWLAELSLPSAEAIYRVARRAAEIPELAGDSRRLARRVLAADAGHAGAHRLLAHVQVGDRWFTNPAAAKRALEVQRRSDGFVPYKGGWVGKADLGALRARPELWLLDDDGSWKSKADVMAARGFELFGGEWYSMRDEGELLSELKRLKRQSGDTLFAARAGATRVYHHKSRAAAKATAERLGAAREWLAATLGLADEDAVRTFIFEAYAFEGLAELRAFARENQNRGPADPAYVEASIGAGALPLAGGGAAVGVAVHARAAHPENLLVAYTTMSAFRAAWRNSFAPPAWLELALAHHAEIRLLGSRATSFSEPGGYGGAGKTGADGLAVRDLGAMKPALRRLAAKTKGAPLRELSTLSISALGYEHALIGDLAALYLLDEKKAGLGVFTSGATGAADVASGFATAFGLSFEAADQELLRWAKK
jgi:hypothetical protein